MLQTVVTRLVPVWRRSLSLASGTRAASSVLTLPCKLVEGVTAGRVSNTLPSFFSQQHLGEVPKQVRGSSDLYLRFVKAGVFLFPQDF